MSDENINEDNQDKKEKKYLAYLYSFFEVMD